MRDRPRSAQRSVPAIWGGVTSAAWARRPSLAQGPAQTSSESPELSGPSRGSAEHADRRLDLVRLEVPQHLSRGALNGVAQTPMEGFAVGRQLDPPLGQRNDAARPELVEERGRGSLNRSGDLAGELSPAHRSAMADEHLHGDPGVAPRTAVVVEDLPQQAREGSLGFADSLPEGRWGA